MENNEKILIVDDEQIALENLEIIMEKENYDVKTSSSGKEALKMLQKQEFDVVLTDLRMDEVDGMQILTECKKLYPESEVIMITAYASLPSAIETMKKGAYYYLAKPFKLDEVRKVVKEALEKVKLKKENAELREQIESYKGKVKIISQDSRMRELLEMAKEKHPDIEIPPETTKDVLIAFINDGDASILTDGDGN